MCESKQKARAKRLRDCFNLSIEEWEKINEFQKGLCFICGKSQKSGKRLATDHDHTSGQVLGLLCSQCNRLFGKIINMGWRTPHLKRLLEYIAKPPAAEALGYPVYGFPGRVGTKRHREFLRKQKKQ